MLFFLHIPKCAGMTLTDSLLSRLSAGEIYQSTSLIRNFRENRPEFPLITNYSRLRGLTGHWLHEEMLPALKKPVFFASSIRHPVKRIHSQYRFDMGMRNARWQAKNVDEFLAKNRNVIVTFVNRAFPTISGDYEDPVEGCKAILSGMDCLFDVEDADRWIPQLVEYVVGRKEDIRRSNESNTVSINLPISDEEISRYCDRDLEVYNWFSQARAQKPGEKNPVYDKSAHDKLAAIGARSYKPSKVIDYLVPKIAAELMNELPNPNESIAYLQNCSGFLSNLEHKMEDILNSSR